MHRRISMIISGVDLRSVGEQQICYLDAAKLGNLMQRTHIDRDCGVHLCAVAYEEFDKFLGSSNYSEVQKSHPAILSASVRDGSKTASVSNRARMCVQKTAD